MRPAEVIRASAAASCRLVSGRAPRGGGVVLGYHDVVAGTEAAPELNVTADQLRSQLGTVRRLGFRFVTLSELCRLVREGSSTDGLAAVTFDDALAGVGHHALPVLQELGVPATLFAVSAQWGLSPRWWPGSAPMMSRSELREAHHSGVTVGAHSRTHASLPGLGGARLHGEVAGCRADLEDVVEGPVRLFAYPFGHHDEEVRDRVDEAGYDAAFTFLNGRIAGAEDRFRLPRLTMGRHHGPARLAYHLARPAGSWPDHQVERVGDAAS